MTDMSKLPPPERRPLPLLSVAASDSLHHAAAVIDSLINNTLVPGTPGEEPTRDQIKAAFNRIRYDIELAEAQAGFGPLTHGTMTIRSKGRGRPR